MSMISIVNIQKSLKPMTMMARHERTIVMAKIELATSTTKQVTATTTWKTVGICDRFDQGWKSRRINQL